MLDNHAISKLTPDVYFSIYTNAIRLIIITICWQIVVESFKSVTTFKFYSRKSPLNRNANGNAFYTNISLKPELSVLLFFIPH